jgi:transcription-repair coupling factor (superfamily II helicase)
MAGLLLSLFTMKEAGYIQAIQSAGRHIHCCGSWGSFPARLASILSDGCSGAVLLIYPHMEDADYACEEIEAFCGKRALFLPAWEAEADLSGSLDETTAERMKAAVRLRSLGRGEIVCASVQGLAQPISDPDQMQAEKLSLSAGEIIEPELLAGWLVEQGYESEEAVDAPGDFSRRGGIIDIYPPVADITLETDELLEGHATRPVRLEFFGDEIETIRLIDLDNQTSGEDVARVELYSSVQQAGTKVVYPLELVPEDALIMMVEPLEQADIMQAYLRRLDEPEQILSFAGVYGRAHSFRLLEIGKFSQLTEADGAIELGIKSLEHFKSGADAPLERNKQSLEAIARFAEESGRVELYCESPSQISRCRGLLESEHGKVPERLELKVGCVKAGFFDEQAQTLVIAHHEVFAQHFIRRRNQTKRLTSAIDTLSDLAKGDFVVHVTNGIARYCGVRMIDQNGALREHLVLEFADKVNILVPVNNIALVHKYLGAGSAKPRLSKLGTKKWFNQKRKVEEAIDDMASEMLELQAKRVQAGGFAYPADCQWQLEFEQAFPYRETADQLTAIEQVKADMHRPVAMDRLLCGDVGYGKTEVAMRAAFKAVLGGKQVAVLVPTTILSVQHARSFNERFAGYPVCVEVLNRFVTKKDAAAILARVARGEVDVLIGTHRILSRDVVFKDLGLIIIDEEQRFGVKHKERLKQLRANVDILTLSATPIPRTLHMALIGLRDVSTLSTPPVDRRSVATSIHRYNEQLVRRVISRELARKGQVFFLHNVVKTIDRMANELRSFFPDARIAVAHGQMRKSELEKQMLDFVCGKSDVLVCSTIIESGIDIPNANTIVINNADKFGLAQLHQLRGRVGRFSRKAYAELLIAPNRPMTPIAARRLKSIEEYSELGAGFKIALRDLEIRGAGNILGTEQSGHIDSIGYELYCKMLADAVSRLSGSGASEIRSVTVLDIGLSCYLPKNYIPSDKQRLGAYRKAAEAASIEDLNLLRRELRDVFGKLPPEAEDLLDIAGIRIAASEIGIERIKAAPPDLIFYFPKDFIGSRAGDLFARTKHRVTVADPRTVHIRLTPNHFAPPTLIATLRKLFKL